jgi:DNA-binding response OmpR family regulator
MCAITPSRWRTPELWDEIGRVRGYHKGMSTDTPAHTATLVMNHADRDCKLIRSMLRKIGFEVVRVESAATALQAGPASLMIVDPSAVPGGLGEFLADIRRNEPAVRVVCLCAPEEQKSLPEDAVGAFVERPFRRAHLLAAILDVIAEPEVQHA